MRSFGYAIASGPQVHVGEEGIYIRSVSEEIFKHEEPANKIYFKKGSVSLQSSGGHAFSQCDSERYAGMHTAK